ncbi:MULTISPECIES: hypothetical protein [unclassified Streptomyces]|uniref:hypothetical protein n=1 Tax=unclassified Streptomyces TaxID=2593676 RepID=UPI0033F08C33
MSNETRVANATVFLAGTPHVSLHRGENGIDVIQIGAELTLVMDGTPAETLRILADAFTQAARLSAPKAVA